MRSTLSWLPALMIACAMLLTSGCTIGPRVETRIIIVRNDATVSIVDSRKIRVMAQDKEGNPYIDHADLGGFVAVPPDAFKKLQELARIGMTRIP